MFGSKKLLRSTRFTSVVTCRFSSNRVAITALESSHDPYIRTVYIREAARRWWPVRSGARSNIANGATISTKPTYQSRTVCASMPCQPSA